jgi:hypothetical protein
MAHHVTAGDVLAKWLDVSEPVTEERLTLSSGFAMS